jgi:hypothetical protein
MIGTCLGLRHRRCGFEFEDRIDRIQSEFAGRKYRRMSRPCDRAPRRDRRRGTQGGSITRGPVFFRAGTRKRPSSAPTSFLDRLGPPTTVEGSWARPDSSVRLSWKAPERYARNGSAE